MGLLKNHSKVVCVSAGAGHEVMALSKMGLEDVTGVELLVLAFEALYPMQYAREMERTVRKGGLCVVVVECGKEEVKEIVRLFRRSRLLGSADVTLNGRRVTRIIMRTKVSA
ncbi:hypothetical protein CRYUN_Cryun30bG0084400 [Craigia yunnanensis]